MPTVPSVLLTSEDEINRLFSTSGVSLRIDDLSAGDQTTFKNEIIYQATETIYTYLETLYELADLGNSYWVRQRATYIAAYLLSLRKGNPGHFVRMYNEAIADLEAVQSGSLQVPSLYLKEDLSPSMSNLTVDNRYHLHKQRVHPSISTGGTTGREHLAWAYGLHEWI